MAFRFGWHATLPMHCMRSFVRLIGCLDDNDLPEILVTLETGASRSDLTCGKESFESATPDESDEFMDSSGMHRPGPSAGRLARSVAKLQRDEVLRGDSAALDEVRLIARNAATRNAGSMLLRGAWFGPSFASGCDRQDEVSHGGREAMDIGGISGIATLGGVAMAAPVAGLALSPGVAPAAMGRMDQLVQLIQQFSSAEVLLALLLAGTIHPHKRIEDPESIAAALCGLALANQSAGIGSGAVAVAGSCNPGAYAAAPAIGAAAGCQISVQA